MTINTKQLNSLIEKAHEKKEQDNLPPEFSRVSVDKDDDEAYTFTFSACVDNKQLIESIWGDCAARRYPNLAQHGFYVAYENDKGIVYAGKTEDPQLYDYCQGVFGDICVKGLFGPIVIDLKK